MPKQPKRIHPKFKDTDIGILSQPELNWPVIIGKEGRAIAIYTQNPLGRGGFGEVYLGVDLDTQEQCAVKKQTIPKSLEKHDALVQEIRHENSILQHMGNLHDHLELTSGESTVTYTVQDLLWGENLSDLLDQQKKTQGKLTVDAEVEMCLSIVEALKEINDKGVLHRDIKIDQVLWDEKEKKAYLTDFGLAILANQASDLKEVVGNYAAVPSELWGKVAEIKNGHLLTPQGCTQGEKTEIFGLATILVDVLSDASPKDNFLKYYEDAFYDLLKKNDIAACAYRYHALCKGFLPKADPDPIRNGMIEHVNKMLNPNPTLRPTFKETADFLKKCQKDIKSSFKDKGSSSAASDDDEKANKGSQAQKLPAKP